MIETQDNQLPRYPGIIRWVVVFVLMTFFGSGIRVIVLGSLLDVHRDYWLLATPLFYTALAGFFYATQPSRGITRYFAAQAVPWKSLLILPFLCLGIWMVVMGLSYGVFQSVAVAGVDPYELGTPRYSYEHVWVRLFGVLVIAPFFEELLMRALLLQGLLQRYGEKVSIFVSAGLFAALHLSPPQMVVTLFGGLVAGWLFVKTRSLWVVVVEHFCHNFFNHLIGSSLRKLLRISADLDSLFDPADYGGPSGWTKTVMVFCLVLAVVAIGTTIAVMAYHAFARAYFPVPVESLITSSSLDEFKAHRTKQSSANNLV